MSKSFRRENFDRFDSKARRARRNEKRNWDRLDVISNFQKHQAKRDADFAAVRDYV